MSEQAVRSAVSPELVGQALRFVRAGIDALGFQPFRNDEEWSDFIDEYGNAGALFMAAQSTLEEALTNGGPPVRMAR